MTRRPARQAAHGSGRTVLRSFTALASGETAGRLVGFVVLVLLARTLQPAALGLVILGTTLVNWFRIVVDSGTETLGVRDISRDPRRFREIADPILGLRLALSAIAGIIFFIVALLVADGDHRHVMWLFALLLPVTALNLRWMVLGVRAAKSVAVGNVGGQVLILVGVLLFVGDSHDVVAVPAIQTAGELLYALVVAGVAARRFGLVRPRVDLASWRETLRTSMPIMGNQAARGVLYSFDILLIGLVIGSTEVGLYGAAYKPVLFLSGLIGLYAVSFLSAYSASGDTIDQSELCRRAVRVAAAVTVPVALVMSVGAGTGLELAYGGAYGPATTALTILAWSIPVLAVGVPFAQVLIATNRQRLLFRHTFVAAALAIVADLAAVPLIGIEGAAGVTVASFTLILALNYRTSVGLGLVPSLGAIVARGPQAPQVAARAVAGQR